jgi:cytidyltransferase-like protein
MTKVIVFGTFDIIHPGHIHLLKEAKEYGDFLIVVVARDDTVCVVKGKAPYYNEGERVNHIVDLNIADKVILGCLDPDDRYKVIADEKPDIIALGYDQKVFVDKLAGIIDDNVKIVRISPYLPDLYKSSKLGA